MLNNRGVIKLHVKTVIKKLINLLACVKMKKYLCTIVMQRNHRNAREGWLQPKYFQNTKLSFFQVEYFYDTHPTFFPFTIKCSVLSASHEPWSKTSPKPVSCE